MTLPNIITLIRLISVPMIVYAIINDAYVIAFWVFVAAGISDAADGFIAKQFNARSELGAYLDPLADKALLISIYIAVTLKGYLPVWLTVLVVSRDILIIGGVMLAWFLGKPLAMSPIMVSKANTTVQIALAAAVLAMIAFDLSIGALIEVLVFVAAGLTVVSMIAYLVDWVRHMSDDVPPEDGVRKG